MVQVLSFYRHLHNFRREFLSLKRVLRVDRGRNQYPVARAYRKRRVYDLRRDTGRIRFYNRCTLCLLRYSGCRLRKSGCGHHDAQGQHYTGCEHSERSLKIIIHSPYTLYEERPHFTENSSGGRSFHRQTIMHTTMLSRRILTFFLLSGEKCPQANSISFPCSRNHHCVALLLRRESLARSAEIDHMHGLQYFI